MSILPARKARITLLLVEELMVLNEYSNFTSIFSKESAAELFKRSDINEYAIDLEYKKQLFYSTIYSLSLIEFKTLKIYTKTNPANGFIRPFKSLPRTPILFV